MVVKDTGCFWLVIRRNQVSESQKLDKESHMTLIDGSKQRYSLAHMNVDC